MRKTAVYVALSYLLIRLLTRGASEPQDIVARLRAAGAI